MRPALSARALDADVVVIGDGVIGLSTALELARAGARAHIVGVRRAGSASGAAAGLLAPSIGRLAPEVRSFFDSSLARYPAFVEQLRRFDPELSLVEGLLQVSTAPAISAPGAVRLAADSVMATEPALSAPNGATMHPRDGAIDNVRLMSALTLAVARDPGLTVTSDDPAARVTFESAHVDVRTREGRSFKAQRVVLAAGAWSAEIAGLPRPLPVTPLKGQMLAFGSRALRHAVAGDDVYLVPRSDEIVAGATVEHAGFDTSVDWSAIERLRIAAVALCPSLAKAPVIRRWSGIRPATRTSFPSLARTPKCPVSSTPAGIRRMAFCWRLRPLWRSPDSPRACQPAETCRCSP